MEDRPRDYAAEFADSDAKPPSVFSCTVEARSAIQSELTRIVGSETFRTAEAQKRFLRYVVENTLSGTLSQLKEAPLGIHVFRRGPAFDSRIDPIVRVEARKLRARLAKYYQTEAPMQNPEPGRFRIELPSGGYVARFQSQLSEPTVFGGRTKSGEQLSRATSGTDSISDPAETTAIPPPTVANGDGAYQDSPLPADGVRAALQPNKFPLLARGAFQRIGAVAGLLVLASAGIYASRFILRGWPPAKASSSIAVLPFKDLGDNRDESFSEGLTDEIIDSLGRVRGLQVVARTSAFQFRSSSLDVRQIGRMLDVRTVLEGSVRIYGNRLRITVELDDTRNGFRIWSNSYERGFEDALFLQRDISEAIVAALQTQLAAIAPGELKLTPTKASPVNVEAYQDYLRGLYFWNKQTTSSIESAKHYFEKSLEQDPNHASSYTGLARCYVNMPGLSKTTAREVAPRIRELARKALKLDPNLPEAHIDLAYASFLERDLPNAESEFQRGLALAPGDAVAHRLFASYLADVGRLSEALSETEIGKQLDPVSPYMFDGIGVVLYQMGRLDESMEYFKESVELDPQFGPGHLGLASVLIEKGRYSEAVSELTAAQKNMTDSPRPIAAKARVYALTGKTDEARKILNSLLQQAASGPYPTKPIAEIYAALGENDRALLWLSKGADARDVHVFLKSDPAFKALRADTRFRALLARTDVIAAPRFATYSSSQR